MIIISQKGIYYLGSVRYFRYFLKSTMAFDIPLKALLEIKSK